MLSPPDEAYVDSAADFDVAVVSHKRGKAVSGCFWFYVAALVWMEEYILAAQQFVVAGAVGLWFFQR